MTRRCVLVGESNPYGDDPKYALYPRPMQGTGGRLCKILGVWPHQYLRRFERVNLCPGKWSARIARVRAEGLVREAFFDGSDPTFVLLGAKVCRAFKVEFTPFKAYTHWATELLADGHNFGGVQVATAIVLPHPSGRNRLWNDPGAEDKARRLLKEWLMSDQCSTSTKEK